MVSDRNGTADIRSNIYFYVLLVPGRFVYTFNILLFWMYTYLWWLYKVGEGGGGHDVFKIEGRTD